MKQRTLVIANPNAGGRRVPGNLARRLAEIDSLDLRFTEARGHAVELAAEAGSLGYHRVVAAGGDGTVNEVVNGLMRNEGPRRLGLIPLGTGNDFARSLGLSHHLETALAVLDRPQWKPCDVVSLRGAEDRRYFVNMSAGGASGEVSDHVTTAIKSFWGPLAYLRAALATLPSLEPYQLHLTLDTGEVVSLEALNLVVANARFIAAGVQVAPQAEWGDGLLDIIVFASCTPTRLAMVTACVLAGTHLSDDCVEVSSYRSTTLQVTSEPAMPFNVDGELLAPQSVSFEVVPQALEVATPHFGE
ncbi:MAG: diacylglycerol kinase family lipid kinase [Thermoanaerobaculia bacterium]|nr:diacylglycerol kinase family lipid kinase [Thermoanaerobaculia bacterium]